MTTGKVEYAIRKAQDIFDQWNDVTGIVPVHSSYYYELLSLIEDAVHVGIQVTLYGDVKKDEDGQLIKERQS